MTLIELFRQIRARLSEAGVETPDLDARLLLEHFARVTHVELIANPDTPVANDKAAVLDAAVRRRVAGEPVHRILGYREFYGLRLSLSPETLEPRPDTEILVEAVLPYLRTLVADGVRPRILDLGTGTGAIALALLHQVSDASAVGVDISEGALATAAANAALAGMSGRFEACRSDWFSAVSGKFHAIVANPPYIRSEVMKTLSREVRDFDPVRALDGGADGLDAYRIIASQSANYLLDGGVLAVEIGHDQRAQVSHLFQGNGFDCIGAFGDLSGNDRVLAFGNPGPRENE